MGNEQTDEELVRKAQCGDKAAMDELLKRFRGYVKGRSRCFFLAGSEADDLIQEGMIGLYEAIMDFSECKGVPFKAFAKICVYRQIVSAIKSANRLKQKPLNEYVPLSAPIDTDGEENIYIDIIDETIGANPEEVVLNKELIELLRSNINKCLSGGEKQILSSYLSGLSYHEISEKLKKSTKSIDNTLYRIRKKLKKTIETEN